MQEEGEFSMVWNSNESTLPIQVRIRKLVDLIFDTKLRRIGDVTGKHVTQQHQQQSWGQVVDKGQQHRLH